MGSNKDVSGEDEEGGGEDQVIDNGIMYMKGDKIVYYNLGPEESGDEDNEGKNRLKKNRKKQQNQDRGTISYNRPLKSSVLSQCLADGSQNPLEGLDLSEIIEDENELEKFYNVRYLTELIFLCTFSPQLPNPKFPIFAEFPW